MLAYAYLRDNTLGEQTHLIQFPDFIFAACALVITFSPLGIESCSTSLHSAVEILAVVEHLNTLNLLSQYSTYLRIQHSKFASPLYNVIPLAFHVDGWVILGTILQQHKKNFATSTKPHDKAWPSPTICPPHSDSHVPHLADSLPLGLDSQLQNITDFLTFCCLCCSTATKSSSSAGYCLGATVCQGRMQTSTVVVYLTVLLLCDVSLNPEVHNKKPLARSIYLAAGPHVARP